MHKTDLHRPVLTRRRFLIACGGVAAAGFYSLSGARRVDGLQRVERSSAALGTSVSITAFHLDRTVAERAIDAAFVELARVERIMSLYQPDSQLCRLNRDGALADPDPDLVTVLEHACDVARRSDGAFDPTVQPLWSTYATAQRAGRLPTDAEVAAAVGLVDWRKISISRRELRLHGAGMALTLNGIAQGYATDRAMAVIRSHGVDHALVNAGEIGSLGQKAGSTAWRVGIQHPREKDACIGIASLDGRCISTSGDYATAFSPDLKSNHILDPMTGRSPDTLRSVSVIAPTATEADALSTAIFVLGPERGMALAQSSPRTDVLFVLNDGRVLKTTGFPMSTEDGHAG